MKKSKIITLILASAVLVSSCGDSDEQKFINAQNLNRAEKNALEYIEEKYGFTPEITESILERNPGLFGSTPGSSALIRMEHNGEEFSVYIDGSDDNTEGADDYQYEEILEALTDHINDTIPDVKNVNISGGKGQYISYDEIEEYRNNLYNEYFDGDNFEEVLGEWSCTITADYVNADFEELTENDFDFLSESKISLTLLSYRSDDDYRDRPDYHVFNSYTGIEKYALLIEESLSFEKGEAEHNEYILGKHDDFYYYVSENTPDAVSIKHGDMPDASEFDGHGIIDGVFVTPTYFIESSANEIIYIYYPLSELPEKSRLATYSKTDEGENLRVSPLVYDIGDYRMADTALNYIDNKADICFAFITEKENIENEQ